MTKLPNGESDQDTTKSIVDLLAMPEAEDIDFEPPCLTGKFYEVPDLS